MGPLLLGNYLHNTVVFIDMHHTCFVYILANTHNTVLYIGMTTDLSTRLWEHRMQIHSKSFTARYNVHKLVYFEKHVSIIQAVKREKFLKRQGRKYKEHLIKKTNPGLQDLSPNTVFCDM
jgi:putative endonuclease